MNVDNCYTTAREDSPAPESLESYWLRTVLEDRAESALPPPPTDEETDR